MCFSYIFRIVVRSQKRGVQKLIYLVSNVYNISQIHLFKVQHPRHFTVKMKSKCMHIIFSLHIWAIAATIDVLILHCGVFMFSGYVYVDVQSFPRTYRGLNLRHSTVPLTSISTWNVTYEQKKICSICFIMDRHMEMYP